MKRKNLFIILAILILSACQNSNETALPTLTLTSTLIPATQTPNPTSTFIPVSAKDLAGLIISSPILGTPQEHPSYQPSLMITPNGLGIINSEGQLIKFSGAGVFTEYSPSGTQIVYQQGFEDEYYDYIDNLFIYNLNTGETTEILDDIENEGGKTIISWQKDEQEFIYYNDYYTVLFEVYEYFGTKEVLMADITTGQSTLLITNVYQFDVNPDNTQIAYTTGEILNSKTIDDGQRLQRFGCFQPHIYNMNSASSKSFDFSKLTEKPICLGYPKWSSDGEKIAWMGYFEDETFRPIIFNLKEGTSVIYDALVQKPKISSFPNQWFFSETYDGIEPNWIDNSIFWTPSYEVNIETGETSTPRELELLYNPRRSGFIKNPDELLHVSLNEERDTFLVSDINENILNSFFLDDIYYGERYEIIQSGFHLLGRTHIVGWSPFPPPPNVGNN